MHRLATLFAGGAIAALAAIACGGATPPTNVLQGKTPEQVIKLASTQASSSSYHMKLHGTASVDVSGLQGVPPEELNQLGSLFKNLTVEGTGDVQDSKHVRMNLTVTPLLDKPIVVVFYDGQGFVSEDGGKTFADAGSFNLQGLPLSPDEQINALNAGGQLKDLGTTTRNGTSVDHLHATLGPDYLSSLLNKAGGSAQGQQLSQAFAQLIQIKDGGVDAYVRTADGKLDSMDSRLSMSFDIGKLMQLIANSLGGSAGAQIPPNAVTGAMNITEDGTSSFSDYGAKIQVTKPTVDPNAPSLPTGGLFGA
jgi:hypothetical protein